MAKHVKSVSILLLVGATLALAGCDSIREAAGITKEPPDEFAVVTKSPLVIPPDYNLHPPRTGASPTNQVAPTMAAESALFGATDPTAVAANMTGNYSTGEKMLLATAGAANADHTIRQQIDTEGSMQGSDPSFTDRLLFSSGSSEQGKPVDADAEAKRLSAAKAAATVPGIPGQAPASSTQAAPH